MNTSIRPSRRISTGPIRERGCGYFGSFEFRRSDEPRTTVSGSVGWAIKNPDLTVARPAAIQERDRDLIGAVGENWDDVKEFLEDRL